MHLQFLISLSILLTLVCRTYSLGINCRGSVLCAGTGILTQEVLELLNTIDGDRWAEDGQQIACYGFLCAFYQYSNGGSVARAQELAHEIVHHGNKSDSSSLLLPFC